MEAIFPGAIWRPTRWTGHTGAIGAQPRGWILHVAEMNGSPWHVFDGSVSPRRKVSTGWVAKDGTVEQYLTLLEKPWAQADGNPEWWAWETEGYVGEPLTSDQIDALAALHNWMGAPDIVAETPAGRGVGTHFMGGAAWGGHSCPGPIRAAQRAPIIATAQRQRLGQNMPVTDADAKKIADVAISRYKVHRPAGADGSGDLPTTEALGAVWAVVLDIQHTQEAILALLARLTSAGGPSGG